jgi:hypothetical protein
MQIELSFMAQFRHQTVLLNNLAKFLIDAEIDENVAVIFSVCEKQVGAKLCCG